jgi:hypothetical protein
MGLLSLIPAALSIGSSILGSNSAKSTAKAQDRAYQEAAAKSLAAQQENFNRIFQMNDRYVQGGYLGQDALLERLGLVQPGQAGVATGATGGQSAGQSYFLQYPDVAQEFARLQGTPEGQAQLQAIGATTPDAFANFHFSTYGQNEGRTAPAAVAATPATDTPATPATPEPGTELLTAQRPEAPPAPTFERPAAMSAPQLSAFIDGKGFQADPGYQFRVSEALGGVNANFAARGKLRSGDAAKALAGRASDLASQEYNNWFNRQMAAFSAANGQYQYGQNRADNIFADDRAYGTSMWDTQLRRSDTNFNVDRDYQTNRYDTETNNLFRLTDSGRAAAGAVAGAGTNFANAQSNIFGQQADSTAARAAATGAANQQLYGALAAGAGNLFASWGGGARSTPTSSLGAVNYGSVSNPFGNYGQVRF